MPGPVRFLMPGALGCNVIGYSPLCRYLSAGRNLKKRLPALYAFILLPDEVCKKPKIGRQL